MRKVFINNDFYEEDKAVIGTGDLALQRGYAAFDYFRTIHNRPLFLDDYLDRFFNSAREMYIIMPVSREQIREAIHELLAKNNIPESGLRMIITGGYAPDSYTPVKGNLIIQQQPLRLPSKEQFEKGVKIITHEYLRDLPKVKSINYLMGIWLQKRLKTKSLDDVLYYQNNIVSEFPRANVFIVTKKQELVTPSQNILYGITRKKLLNLATGILPVQQRNIRLEELKDASEVFMTSTTKRILPVTEIDGVPVGSANNRPVTAALNAAFLNMENTLITT